MRLRLQCSQVWGGIRDEDVDACSAALDASLLSHACEGGRGGDVYYFSVCDGDQLTRIALADVMGHGERVSEVSQWLFDAMRRRMNDLDGDEILRELNTIALDRGISAMTTAAVGALYRADSSFYFSYAGHHPALVLRRGATHWEPATLERGSDESNLPLGVLPDARYEQGRLHLRSGDRIAMYTDGLIEAPRSDRELFGIDRLRAVLDCEARADLQQTKTAVLGEVRAHTGGSLVHDDVTLLLAELR
jgi:sigma-B regulation protein RsbU (phosphoserine phosphatase)